MRRGRPVLGAIAGLFLGAFVALDLMMFKVRTLDDLSVIGLPAIGLVLGIVLALWAPFGRRQPSPATATETTQMEPPPESPES
jgi:hypothetical protein